MCACARLLLGKLTEGGLGTAVTSPWKQVLDFKSRASPPAELLGTRTDVRAEGHLEVTQVACPSVGGSEAPSHVFRVTSLKPAWVPEAALAFVRVCVFSYCRFTF